MEHFVVSASMDPKDHNDRYPGLCWDSRDSAISHFNDPKTGEPKILEINGKYVVGEDAEGRKVVTGVTVVCVLRGPEEIPIYNLLDWKERGNPSIGGPAVATQVIIALVLMAIYLVAVGWIAWHFDHFWKGLGAAVLALVVGVMLHDRNVKARREERRWAAYRFIRQMIARDPNKEERFLEILSDLSGCKSRDHQEAAQETHTRLLSE